MKTKRAAATGPVDGPWALPDGWRWERLYDVCRPIEKGSPSSRFTNTFRYTDVGGVGEGLAFKEISVLKAPSRARQFVRDGDTLFSGVRINLRRTVFVTPGMTDVASTAFSVLSPDEEVEPRFLHSWMITDHLVKTLLPFERGNQPPAVLDQDVRTQLIPVPPRAKQREIVARIDELFTEIDDGEAALGQAREDLGTWRKALLKAAVTGELTADWRAANPPTETGADLLARILVDRRAHWEADTRNQRKRYKEPAPANGEKLSALPDGWSWATMEQLSWASGYGSSEKCSAEAMGTPVLRIPNIRGGVVRFDNMKFTVSPMDIRDGNAVDVGDLLIIRTNGSEDLIGRAALVMTRPYVMTYFASYLIRLRLLGPRQLLRWIAVLVDSPVFRAAVLRSIASSAGQFNLNLTKIERFALPIPPIDEIEVALSRFKAAEDQADAGAEIAKEATDNAASLRQSILAAAFRGDIA